MRNLNPVFHFQCKSSINKSCGPLHEMTFLFLSKKIWPLVAAGTARLVKNDRFLKKAEKATLEAKFDFSVELQN